MGRRRVKSDEEVKFHCPYDECLYSEGSARYFSKKFNLKQHLLKVHTQKSFSCQKCHVKKFSTEKLLAYHEKNCGLNWSCSCGLKYDMRETLLTHARRTLHKLPDNIRPPKRKLDSALRINKDASSNNIRVIPVQMITINSSVKTDSSFITLLNPLVAKTQTTKQFRTILPKPRTKVINGNINCFSDELLEPVNYKVESTTQTEEVFCNATLNKSHRKELAGKNVETQTSRRSIFQKIHKKASQVESRGSQCYPGQKTRRRSVRLESIETQTELILDKMKRVLRSNVASKKGYEKPSLVDESSNTSDLRVDVSAQSVLSCLDLLLNSRWSKPKSKCSSGTQTSPRCKRARDTCDSKTGTDDILEENDDFGMLSLLATVCQSLANKMISQSNKSMNYPSEKDPCSSKASQEVRGIFQESTDVINKPENYLPNIQNSSESRDFDLMNCDDDNYKVPLSLNMETQTSSEECRWVSMETQTIEDLFPDLELSDIQTQTPWNQTIEDFFDEKQLSAEIQTDITSQDFVNNESETLPILELTSSYTQTLDEMCDYFGIEEKIDLD